MTVLEFRVAREFDVVKVRLTAAAKERIEQCKLKTKEAPHGRCTGCLEPLLDPALKQEQRGCHKGCCKDFYKAIERGDLDEEGDPVTNESLLKKGKWLLPQKGGRKSKSKAVAGFRRATA